MSEVYGMKVERNGITEIFYASATPPDTELTLRFPAKITHFHHDVLTTAALALANLASEAARNPQGILKDDGGVAKEAIATDAAGLSVFNIERPKFQEIYCGSTNGVSVHLKCSPESVVSKDVVNALGGRVCGLFNQANRYLALAESYTSIQGVESQKVQGPEAGL